MAFILVDRRKSGHGKSSENRQKLIKRVKSFIKSSTPQNVGLGGVAGHRQVAGSPVKVAATALDEPQFFYDNNRTGEFIFIGNSEFERGDAIEIQSEESSRNGGPGDGGEDDFVINIARDEFLNLFFEDCELPNLVNERYTEKLDNTFQIAGYSPHGNPAQLAIVRTYKQLLARRRAMTAPYTKEIKELEQQLLGDVADEQRTALMERIKELKLKVTKLHGFDNSDIRFRRRESKPLKTVDSVLFLVMDISGSMDEHKKTIARRWFALLYAFIKRRYTSTELVFIAHTDEAFEMSEDDFFSTRLNGGTCVSPALKMINDIITARYDPNQTNIYVCHASDGDNWDSDESVVEQELIGPAGLLKKIQLFSYAEVGEISPWMSTYGDTSLWSTYKRVKQQVGIDKMSLSVLQQPDDCYSVFQQLFKKKGS